MRFIFTLTISLFIFSIQAQDLSFGLEVNDMELHPMQDISKPDYLSTYIDPSFGTSIRRISNAEDGNALVPMYSTIQGWNADESLLIIYDVNNNVHRLLDGFSYELIRELSDISPMDLEQLFWDFNNPDLLYYPEAGTDDFIQYTMSSQTKEVLVNLSDISNCSSEISLGNDVQMMSWDSDVLSFRCGNQTAYFYTLSSGELVEFEISQIEDAAPAAAPSGSYFYHNTDVYDENGELLYALNESSVEHSCVGKLPNGNDAHFAIAFEEGPNGGCIGDIIAHDLSSGDCFPVISESMGYDYPQSGTHISSLAHKNTEGGWVAASMVGYDEDGQELLDQELVIAHTDAENIKVCRIGHHRSDETEFDYWGEPHPCISPTGTRVLFASDWSGDEDGQSVDCYVVELPSFSGNTISNTNQEKKEINVFPNPANDFLEISTNLKNEWQILTSLGTPILNGNSQRIETSALTSGCYFITSGDYFGRFVKL